MILEGPKAPVLTGISSIGSMILDTLKQNSGSNRQITIGESGDSYNFGRLAEESIRCALWLEKRKIGAGDFILICNKSDNISSLASYLSVLYVGAIACGWVHTISPDRTRHHIKLTEPKIIFATGEIAYMLKNILEEENIDSKIVVFDDLPGFKSFDSIMNEQNAKEVEEFKCNSVSPENDAAVFFSSGSTGHPKCIIYSYEKLRQSIFAYKNELRKENCSLVSLWTLTLNGMVGVMDMLICILSDSQVVIINNDSTEEDIWRTVEEYKVQSIYLPAAAFNKLAKSNKITKFNLSSLISIRTSGLKIKAEAVKVVDFLLPNCQVIVIYGTNEFGGLASIMDRYDNNNEDYCGRLCSNVQMKIVDVSTGEILGSNRPGEMYLKRPFMMKGYFKSPDSTADTIDSEGWLHTGDFGYHDEKGDVYIIDRLRNMIKYRNEFVSSSTIEDDFLKHPEVLEVSVIGVSHHSDGEHPLAFVVRIMNSKVSEEELLKFSADFGKSKILCSGVIFIEKIPLLISGKIDKLKLKEIARSETEKKSLP